MHSSTSIYNISAAVKHYNLHKAEFNDDVYTFIDKHFGKQKEIHKKHHEHSDHEKLPFKECKFHIHNYNLFIPDYTLALEMVIKNYKPELNAAYVKNFDSLNLLNLLDPLGLSN
ncbi:MAG: hypothetical protein ACTJGD_02415 [Mesonia hippocampi]|uniref:hypothetical protein n=1 Tax=Mesonia hippocampi TaxID=1628250 RepID=UPI003F9B2210